MKQQGAKFALLACVVSFLFGVLEIGSPLETVLRATRNKLRVHDASGQIVVIGIDSKSLNDGLAWPWPRSEFGKTLKELERLGAKRVFFDLNFASPTTEAEDGAFELALEKSKIPVFLQARLTRDPNTGRPANVAPMLRFQKHSQLSSHTLKRNAFGESWKIEYSYVLGGKLVPSLASRLGNKTSEKPGLLPIDYSIDPRSVPYYSATDLMDRRIAVSEISGKDVVVGLASPELEEWRTIPGYGQRPRLYTQILGGETLLKGIPLDAGWMPLWLVAVGIFSFYARVKQSQLRRAVFFFAIGAMYFVPLGLEFFNVFADAAPALLLLLILGANRSWLRFKAALHRQGITNVVSGLKNLNALREMDIRQGTVLVVANIRNFASIRSALEAERERELTDEISKRLTVGSEGIELFQGDDGVFAWLLERGRAGNVGDHVEAIHSFFRSPLIIGGRAIQLHVTFGVDEDDGRLLTNRMGTAIVASQEAEKSGRRWLMSDAEKSKDVEQKLDLIGRLDSAISDGELWVAYQPKLDLKTRHICGAEALVRWTHPERGELKPDEFVTLAEEQNCIGNLTAFVLTNAIQLAARINASGVPFGIAVNLSPRVIDGLAIDLLTKSLLERHGLSPALLTMEVTETAAMASGDDFLGLLLRLRDMGVQISVDDYGSGLSTLGYIRTIPATEIKIDKAFVRNIHHSVEDQVMVRSTVEMAHSLGRKVVAEGVESEGALISLGDLGCDMAQGYHIGRPMPIRQLFRTVLKMERKRAA